MIMIQLLFLEILSPTQLNIDYLSFFDKQNTTIFDKYINLKCSFWYLTFDFQCYFDGIISGCVKLFISLMLIVQCYLLFMETNFICFDFNMYDLYLIGLLHKLRD